MQGFVINSEAERGAALQAIKSLPLTPALEISIQEYKTKRSAAQNRLYWRWLSEIAGQIPNKHGNFLSKEEWHYLCSIKFLGVKTIQEGATTYAIPLKSTTKLTLAEFGKYLLEIESEFIPRGAKLTFTDDYGPAMGLET